MVQSLDKADRAHGGTLLAEVPDERLYESSLTVMMRLVFLFCAEERELLLLGDELYDKNYAVSTLREQLRTTADNHGEEILERRNDAWSRLLTTFRAVYGGVLSSDAVGSTQLKQRLGDEAGAALEPRPVPRPHHFGSGGLRP